MNKNQAVTKCKCNAGGRSFSAFSPCSTTANPSLTDFGLKNMFNIKSRLGSVADLAGNRFKSRTPLAPTVGNKFKKARIVKCNLIRDFLSCAFENQKPIANK